MRMYRLAIVVVTGLLVSAIVAGPASAIPSKVSVRAQEGEAPQLLFTGLELADHVRYAVTLVRPLSATVTNVRVDVSLPAGAELTETLQTPNRNVFIGVDGNVLSWGAPSYEAGDPVDTFTFRLARPLNGEAHVRGSWELDGQPRADEIRAAPEVQVARAGAGEVILQRGIETATIGETGVQVWADPESGLDGVTLRVRKPGPDANPPAGVGSPWWCAMLAVEGLPAGASVFVVVPLRQPLPPGARVDLFAERGGAWEKLEDQGYATADGQFVAFRHPGGTVAAGVTTRVQLVGFPQGGVAQAPASRPNLRVSISGPPNPRFPSSVVYRIVVSNVGGAAAQQISVVILRSFGLGLTFTSISGTSGGFACRIEPPSGIFGQGFGACNSPSLAAGSAGEILLRVDTRSPQSTLAEGTLSATARDNFLDSSSTSHQVSFPIKIVP